MQIIQTLRFISSQEDAMHQSSATSQQPDRAGLIRGYRQTGRRIPGRRLSIFALLLLTISTLLSACQFTQSSFQRTLEDAGSTFSASATMLAYVHAQKVPKPYASSSFRSFVTQLNGLDQTLSEQHSRTADQLFDLYRPAIQAVTNPCFDETCDWQGQLTALKHASQAFLEASEQ
jgi:hypothetical protein